MNCFRSCFDSREAPFTIIATAVSFTTHEAAPSSPPISFAGIISISVFGVLLLFGILITLAFILIRLQKRRSIPVELRPWDPFHGHRHRYRRRYSRLGWPYTDQYRYPLAFRDTTGRTVGILPRRGRGFNMGEEDSQWPGYATHDALTYGRRGVGVPLYPDQASLRQEVRDYGPEHEEAFGQRQFGRGEGIVDPPNYPVAATALSGRERQVYPRREGNYDRFQRNVAGGAVSDPDFGLQDRDENLRPGSERRVDNRGGRLPREFNPQHRDV